jgi:hypothetical protein
MKKVKLFENSSIDCINAEIAAFLLSENANVVDVKIAVNQSQHKPSYSHFVVALIYWTN